ncbi:MAG: malate/lactate/ureidoglycolate dehydrogenase [Gammaproteobacteria bacterium]|nr:malate/lactate/ureidoglycolate dehydrogenase [Gammaproteobacteria bacterium]
MATDFGEAGLRRVIHALLVRAGSTPEEATQVSDHLVEANLKGHDSHGVGMIPHYIKNLLKGTMNPNTGVALVKDGGAVMMFDGQRGYGQRVGAEMMATLIERAKAQGAVVATLRNVHHLGRIGTYAEMAVEAGLVSMHFVNVTGHGPTVAPFGGAEARFATNPVSIGVPGTASKAPFVMDMATSMVAMGKVRVANNKGDTMAPGLLVDGAGAPSTDPGVMYPPEGDPRGAILPFGMHKGYCLMFASEILAGVLGGGGTIQPENQTQDSIINNMFSVVIDPAHFVDATWMESEMNALRDYAVSARPASESEPVLTPGDPERATKAERLANGIPVDATTWGEILAAGESVGFPASEAEALLAN